MSTKLFEEFSGVSEKEWKQKIQADLKGAAYESLLFHSAEGIDVKPFYHPENLKESLAPTAPENWKITERFVLAEGENITEKIVHNIEKGTESLWLVIPSEKIDFLSVLAEVDLKKIPVFIELQFLSEKTAKEIQTFLSGKKHQITLGIDIVGNLASTGNWYKNLNADFEKLHAFLQLSPAITSSICINLSIYQNAGANMVQQMAYALSHANEYLNYISNHFSEDIKKNFKPTFLVAHGSNYFFEIAKLKALRNLYATIASAYQMPEEISIVAFPTQRNKTLYDYNVNMLRTTTECMSGILGGANFVCNFAYDEIYHQDNEFGSRIARNQLLILKNESYFDKVANIADGSYYIESLIDQLAEKALEIFKNIEKGGGFLTALKEGTIQRKISENAQKEQEEFDESKAILVGTNQYQNLEDKMQHEIQVDPFLKIEKRKTLFQPIIQKRLAEKLEQERLTSEKKS